MEENSLNVIERCDCLRWKGLFVDGGESPVQGVAPIFWCLKTQIGIGPDGQLVSKEECSPGRSCYQPL